MIQVLLEKPEKLVIKEVEKPSVGKDEVIIKVKRVGICGSDIHAYYGKHPFISCPIVQGHEFSGEIVELGEKVSGYKLGDNVTAMPQLFCGECYQCTHGSYHICNSLKVIGCQVEGAAQEYFKVEAKLLVKLHEGMSYDEGAIIEPAAVGVHAAGKLGNVEGKNILIIGAGTIGNLTAQAAKALGAKSVMISDLSEYRLNIAKECGIDFTVNPATENLGEMILRHFGKDGADGIIECVGIESSVEQAIQLSRKGSDIIIVGVFGKKPNVNFGLVQDKEIRLIGSLMYVEKDFRLAMDMIHSGKINVTPLLSEHFSLKAIGEAYKYIESNKDKSMKIIIDVE
ncbi:MAG: yjmD [Clostridiales bacterium]|jgi:L-iditol 2-dehydrogenase|nr:yjmD [Clostridiales bacterium]